MDRDGTLSALRDEPADWKNPEFSPDGGRIAMDITGDIWVYDWARTTMTRVTSEPTHEDFPVWTPDGAGLVYRSLVSSADPSGSTLCWKRADGTGPSHILARGQMGLRPGSWHPRQNLLAYVVIVPGHDDDVFILPLEGDAATGWRPGPPRPFAASPARERAPRFSPDGRWLAYSSNESGIEQLYLQRFPEPGGRIVAAGDGGGASWSPARSELLFTTRVVDYRHALMAVPYRVDGDSIQVGKPRPWAERGATLPELSGYRLYAVHPDGERVAVAPPSDDDFMATHVTLVFNLFDELRGHPAESP